MAKQEHKPMDAGHILFPILLFFCASFFVLFLLRSRLLREEDAAIYMRKTNEDYLWERAFDLHQLYVSEQTIVNI